jgi:signal recognition particle subunit SEC65
MNIKRIEKMKDHEQNRAMEKIQDNYKKMEEFKNQKSMMMTKKKEMITNINKQKGDIMKKFDTILKKNQNLTPEIVKELFPNDDDLYEKLLSNYLYFFKIRYEN